MTSLLDDGSGRETKSAQTKINYCFVTLGTWLGLEALN